MGLFQGSGVAIVTPFYKDGTIDFNTFEELIDFQLQNHTDALIVCGTTGEAATLSESEKLQLIEFAVGKVKGKIPVLAGTGSNCTKTTIAFSKKVEKLQVDGLLVVTPYYNKCTQQGMYLHYSSLAQAVQCPIVLYNVPSRTGCNLLPETAVRLAKEYPNIVAIKEASTDMKQVMKLIRLGHGVLAVYSGCDDLIVPTLSVGGSGVISVLANLLPRQTHDIVEYYFNGQQEAAVALQMKYQDLIEALFAQTNPIPVKAALQILGYSDGTLRAPLTPLEDAYYNNLKKVMNEVGLRNVKTGI